MRNSHVYHRTFPETIQVFERFHWQYDRWFMRNKWAYRSEIEAVKKLIPRKGLGLEVGVGTGRFSTPFGIDVGLDPSRRMVSIAKKRGINVICGVGEHLPFQEKIFDFILNVTTICFVEDPFMTLKETERVLKKGGSVIIGFVDKYSELGKLYEEKKRGSRFYKLAKFYSVDDVQRWLTRLSFTNFSIYQTIFQDLNEIESMEPVKEGYGEGGFIAFKATRS